MKINENNPSKGVFGPIFQISRIDLEKISKNYNLNEFIPSNKNEQQAMERGWAFLAINSNIEINSIEGAWSISFNWETKKDLSFLKIIKQRN